MARKSATRSRSITEKKPVPADDWEFVERVMRSRRTRTVYLWGPPGTGKTYTSMRYGVEDQEVFVVTLTPETPAAELRGFWMPKGNEFVWQDGIFVEAMRKGARVVINEVSHASSDVLAIDVQLRVEAVAKRA